MDEEYADTPAVYFRSKRSMWTREGMGMADGLFEE
jgi:hypothetical protein